jgi:hypothetical protein
MFSAGRDASRSFAMLRRNRKVGADPDKILTSILPMSDQSSPLSPYGLIKEF